jgi:hypothetical protein
MNKEKAFVDTTILTDVLLKPSEKGKIAKENLAKFKETLLPVYAIKEFKAGPLYYFAWIHNKFATTGSFTNSYAALHAMSRTPRRYTTSTALEALKEAAEVILKNGVTNQSLVEKYGAKSSLDATLSDMFRLSIKTSILKSWKRRNNVATKTIQPLSCYEEKEPFENKGLMEVSPTKCKPKKECCLAPELRNKNQELKILVETIKQLPGKTENDRRHKVLHEISRKPRDPISETYCRGLGDAYFALFCPDDAVILSTNIKDHQPLAQALGKEATDGK